MTRLRLFVPVSLALLCAVAVVPWLGFLSLGPVALDSAEWIARGNSGNPDWADWVFGTQHFGVGYRPIAALSFTIDHAIAGFAPWIYRATDLALHATGGLLVCAEGEPTKSILDSWVRTSSTTCLTSSDRRRGWRWRLAD